MAESYLSDVDRFNYGPTARLERAGLMSCTAAGHQRAIQMFRSMFSEAFMRAIFKKQSEIEVRVLHPTTRGS